MKWFHKQSKFLNTPCVYWETQSWGPEALFTQLATELFFSQNVLEFRGVISGVKDEG